MNFDWTAIGTVATILAGVGGALAAFIKRRRIAEYFAKQSSLVKRNLSLESERDFWKNEAIAARASANFLGQTSAFTRAEAQELLERVTKLEEYVPKFDAAIAYIKRLLKHLNDIESWAKVHGHILPGTIPQAPATIVDDIDHP